MFVLITLILLLISSVTMVVLRLTRRPAAFTWLVSALGALLAWVSIPLWQFDLPLGLPINLWAPVTLFNTTPAFEVDSYAWLYALSLGALAAAVILTSPARMAVLLPVAWIGAVALALVALLAVMADNILTLALVWTGIDLLEYLNTLRVSETPSLNERAVISFSFRAAGTGFALWAAVVSAAGGQLASLEATPPQAWLFMLLAVGLRLGVIPLHLAYREDPGLRRGIGSSLRLTAAATSLVVLARLPAGGVEPELLPFLLALVAVAAVYAGWKWLSLPDELSARPYWIIGMGALSLAAALRGSPQGSAAWGAALVLFGGLSFLYSSRQVWFTRLFAGLALFLLSLPFTLTATGWEGDFPLPALFWPLFLSAHAMLVAGYIRHLFRAGDTTFGELPRWAQAAYPFGLGIFVVTILLTGLWGWPGSLQIGVWPVALLMVLLAGLVGIATLRLRRMFASQPSEPVEPAGVSRFVQFQELFAGLLWGLYRMVGRFFGYLSSLLEGDGGLLWTLLLLLIFITALRGL
jgi:hypothetical protein